MFERKIVTESSKTIRAIARDNLRGNWGKVFAGIVLFYVLTSVVPSVLEVIPGLYNEEFIDQLNTTIRTSYASYLYLTFLTGTFTMGLCSFMLAFFRYKDINPGYIFNGFNYFFKSVLLMIVMGFFVFLWSLLLVIPGIVASFRYSQAFFILAEDPSKGVLQCIRESKYIMTGNKFKYLCLELSFIGWYILAQIPSSIFDAFVKNPSIITVLISTVLTLPFCLAVAYQQTALVAFYDLATGRLVARYNQEPPQDFNF